MIIVLTLLLAVAGIGAYLLWQVRDLASPHPLTRPLSQYLSLVIFTLANAAVPVLLVFGALLLGAHYFK